MHIYDGRAPGCYPFPVKECNKTARSLFRLHAYKYLTTGEKSSRKLDCRLLHLFLEAEVI